MSEFQSWRWITIIIIHFVYFTSITHRIVLNIFIVAITKSINGNEDGKFNWSQQTKGLILSSYFIGWLVVSPFSGYAAQKLDGKKYIVVSLALSCMVADECHSDF